MLTRVRRAPVAGDAVDLLLECHVRIRAFLALARRLGEAREETPGALADAALQVQRYFTQALPLHARDEEDSVAVRLRGREPALDRALEDMIREHHAHERPLAELVEACVAIAVDPGRHAGLAGVVLGAVAGLERHFQAHLAREEEVVFPALRRLLDGAADAAVVEEIRARRRPGAKGPPAPPVSSPR
jgi:hypothetical protein